MHLRNDRGVPVDPVPFIVVFALGFLVCYSFGPPYLMALGFTLVQALGLTTGVFAGVTAVAYHRLVWNARPEVRGVVPGRIRFRRLVYAVFVLLALVVLLALPLLLVR